MQSLNETRSAFFYNVLCKSADVTNYATFYTITNKHYITYYIHTYVNILCDSFAGVAGMSSKVDKRHNWVLLVASLNPTLPSICTAGPGGGPLFLKHSD